MKKQGQKKAGRTRKSAAPQSGATSSVRGSSRQLEFGVTSRVGGPTEGTLARTFSPEATKAKSSVDPVIAAKVSMLDRRTRSRSNRFAKQARRPIGGLPAVGKVIRALRESKGMTREALCKAGGACNASLVRVELYEDVGVTTDTLMRILTPLGVSLEEFVEYTEGRRELPAPRNPKIGNMPDFLPTLLQQILDGKAIIEAAEECGVGRTIAYDAVKRVRDAFETE